MDAKIAIELLAQAKLNLSLTECARRAIDGFAESSPSTTTLGEAYATYAEWQRSRNSPHQVKTVAKRVGKFVDIFGKDRLLSEITQKNLTEYLEREFYAIPSKKAKTTYNGNLEYICSFLRWCVNKQHYIKTNPAASIDGFAKEYEDPEYMKPADVEKLFRALETKGGPDLADAILSFWCGMRQEEIHRAAAGESAIMIDLDEKYIRVIKVKGYTRGIKPRAFTIPEQALAWMRSMPDFIAAARTPNTHFREHLKAVATKAGVDLPDNAGRHTFCTMFEAAHHDSNALTAIVGNTESIRDRHYNGIAKPQEGRDYFAIMPSRK
jgi:integrase